MYKIDMPQKAIDEFVGGVLDKINKRKKSTVSKNDLNDLCNLNLKINELFNEYDLKKLMILSFEDMCILKQKIDTTNIDLSSIKKDFYYNYNNLGKIREKFVDNLNTRACPYCNRNYIFNFTQKRSTRTTAQLDHFFPKSEYPIFALSVYNLIPSCPTCNQRKSKNQDEIYHPYTESFSDDYKFRFSLKDIDFYNNEDSITLKPEIIKNTNKAVSHEGVFNIPNLYDGHKDIAVDLIQKARIYSNSYVNELMNSYGGTVFKDRNDLLRLIACAHVEDKDINKRPLNKFIQDISKQLEIL